MITEVIVASTVGVLLLILFLVKCFNNNRHSSSANDKNASKFNESANEFENENQQENILTEEKCNQSQEGNGFGKKLSTSIIKSSMSSVFYNSLP